MIIRSLLLSIFLIVLYSANGQYNHKVFNIDTRPGQSSIPFDFTVFKNKVYFYAKDSANGMELRVYDNNSVSLVADICPGTPNCVDYTYDYEKKYMAVVNDTLYFSARSSPTSRKNIYKYDGINPPVIAADLFDFLPSSIPRQFVSLDNKLYFLADTGLSFQIAEIMEYDPSTGSVKFINSGGGIYERSSLIAWNNLLYYNGNNATVGRELFAYDPQTNSGTVVAEALQGTNGIAISDFEIVGSNLYFMALYPGSFDRQVCEYDGSKINLISVDTNRGVYLTQSGGYMHKAYCSYQGNICMGLRYDTTKWGIFLYDPKHKHLSLFKEAPLATDDRLFSYSNKLYYTDSSLMIGDFNKQSVDIHQSDTTLSFHTIFLTSCFIYNNLLFAAAILDVNLVEYELLVLYDSTLSIANHVTKPKMAFAYPNPATNNAYIDIHIENVQTLSIQLADIQGRTVYLEQPKLYSPGMHKITIPISNLFHGTYVYSLHGTSSLLHHGKIIKQ